MNPATTLARSEQPLLPDVFARWFAGRGWSPSRTPEQLALVLAKPDAPYLLATLKRVVVDELHSLTTSKRGDLL